MKTLGKLALLLLAATLLLTACASPEIGEPPQAGETADLEVHFFDAGKADAILLTTANSAVLIDAGEKGFGKTILAYLEEKGVTHLDYLIVTHFDQDHVGGAAKVLEGVTVGTVLQSNQPKDSKEYEKYIEALNITGIVPVTVREIYEFTLDGVSYAIDPPRKSEYNEDKSNNSSLIVSVTNGDDSFLLTGDAQTERLAEFLDTNRKAYDVLKLPHHGKDEPLLEPLLESVKPSYAVITSSEVEPESEEVLKVLEQAGIRLLLTREGAITLHSDGTAIRFVDLSLISPLFFGDLSVPVWYHDFSG